MDNIEKWGKKAYVRGLDLEDVVEKNEKDISTLKNDMDTLETTVSEMGENTGDNKILLRSIFSGKILSSSTTATSKFICDIESEENSYDELNITFGVLAKTAGTSGNALIEILLDEEVICSKAIGFIESENQIDIKRYIYGTGNAKEIYVRCTCLSVDTEAVAIPFYVKDIVFILQSKQPFIMEYGYSTIAEQIPSASTVRTSNLYIYNIDGIGLHIKEYIPSTGVTNVLDSSSTGRSGVALSADVDEMKTVLLQYKDLSENHIVHPICIRHYVTNQNHLLQVPIVTTASLTPGELWQNYTLAEFYNYVNWGIYGLDSLASLQYRIFVLGYTTTSTNIRVQGLRLYGFTSENTVFDLDCPISVVKAFFHVTNIWANSFNYATMVIFQDESDDLYFQAYNVDITSASGYVDWLERVDACTKVANGTRCTAYYENGVIRFYYIRNRKIYTTTLNVGTREVSAETYVAEGQYYKETEGFYILRNNGIVTYVAK